MSSREWGEGSWWGEEHVETIHAPRYPAASRNRLTAKPAALGRKTEQCMEPVVGEWCVSSQQIKPAEVLAEGVYEEKQKQARRACFSHRFWGEKVVHKAGRWASLYSSSSFPLAPRGTCIRKIPAAESPPPLFLQPWPGDLQAVMAITQAGVSNLACQCQGVYPFVGRQSSCHRAEGWEFMVVQERASSVLAKQPFTDISSAPYKCLSAVPWQHHTPAAQIQCGITPTLTKGRACVYG